MVRFINDILLSAPSILIGLFVYTLMVQPMGGYSGWAGAVALAIIAMPVIVRTTEDMLRIVPSSLREAGAALGAPMATVITKVTWRAARAGMRHRRAPRHGAHRRRDGAASLHRAQQQFLVPARPDRRRLEPARSRSTSSRWRPITNWQELAWAGALVITLRILALSVVARLVLKKDISR